MPPEYSGKSSTNSVAMPGQNVFIDWSPCGKYLITSSKDDHLTLIDASTHKVVQSVKFENELNEPRFTPLSTHVILTTNNGQIRLFTVPDLQPVFAIQSQPGNCYCSDLDPLGETLVVGSTDSIVSFWDVKEWCCKANGGDIKSAVRSLSWSYDSKFVAAGSEERYISIIDGFSHEQVAKVETSGTQNCVRWHPSKYLLAFSCEIPGDHVGAGSVRLWT
ncbi:THO complex subunit 3 [Neolecta irregularis DAH-3]|uniref:THO complex subunit 3 n=1 Tax=Neolecta irregularis (strain DAH-3) TaxID=1198029 RepID=A0A1U7LN24_NEOID|nr:THO complex subunit 3 [Neolecta irregularis DAH-3]|eukprot:OLL24039.1 THO complex subunit 3 [Neolecta irregularis DAH-3]